MCACRPPAWLHPWNEARVGRQVVVDNWLMSQAQHEAFSGGESDTGAGGCNAGAAAGWVSDVAVWDDGVSECGDSTGRRSAPHCLHQGGVGPRPGQNSKPQPVQRMAAPFTFFTRGFAG